MSHGFFILIFTILSSFSHAAVWETTASWNDEYKANYREWVKNEVTTDYFSNPDNKYYGVLVDCADVTYALRAVFAFENGLPFKVKNTLYRKGHRYKYWTNEISKYDKYEDSKKRFIKFINYIGEWLGTYSLVINDSYPLEVSKINSADIYSYKKETDSGYTRHAYNIKAITEAGNFQLIWSNQQRKLEGKPMKYAEWSKLKERPFKFQWGFRRFNFPDDYSLEIEKREDYGIDQFSWAKELDEKAFFKKVKKIFKVRDETPDTNLTRQLKNLCEFANERVEVVKSGDKFRGKIKNRCMDYTEFDNYSTPSRDSRFFDMFKELEETINAYKSAGLSGQIEIKLLNDVESIFDEKKPDTKKCPVTYKKGAKSLSLKAIYYGLKSKKFSSHPNDNIDRRWGKSVGKKTDCKTWY